MYLQLLFWLCAGAVVFTYAGYPVVLFLLAPLRRKVTVEGGHGTGQPHLPTVSLVVAARNEAGHIEAKLRNSFDLDYPADKLEIIVIDDGSEDGTAGLVQAFQGETGMGEGGPVLKLLAQKRRYGKVTALNWGVSEASGEIIVFSDADSLISCHSLRLLVQPFSNRSVGCVAGRYFPGGAQGPNATGLGFYWRYENYLRRKESQVGGLLGASGALYGIRRDLYEAVDPNLINDDFIIPMRVTAKGYRTLYEPSATAIEDEGRCSEVEFSRRVRIMAGNCEHLWMFRGMALDWRRWRTVFQLFCHKFLRVVSPLWLMILIILNGALVVALAPGGDSEPMGVWTPAFFSIYSAILVSQFLFYGLAVVGGAMKGKGMMRLLTLPYYFTMINLAALFGMYYFVFDRKKLAWSTREAAVPSYPAAGQEKLEQT
ncbi:glycosyltransferase family 2 protein [bacterium]|nr:glycosyltransferase family 2 protein [bacterium]